MKNKFWKFENPSTWSQVPDFLIDHDEDVNSNVSAALELEGYRSNPILNLGDGDTGFLVEVFASESHYGGNAKRPYKFLLMVELGGSTEIIVVKDLPDLIELMPKISTLVRLVKAEPQD